MTEVLQEDSPGSEEEHSVKNLASMFNQPIQGPGMGRPAVAAKPKPTIGAKPGKLDLDSSIKIIGPNTRSPLSEKPKNSTVKQPKHVPFTGKIPLGGPILPGANTADILNIKSQLKKAPIPRPPPTSSASEGDKVNFKRSLKKAPQTPPRATTACATTSQKPASVADETDNDTKENVSSSKSEGDCSSLSSFTSDSSIARRGSGTSQKASGGKKPTLEPLPPLATMGPPPKKPAKPENIRLPKPAVASNKSALFSIIQDAEPVDAEDDSGEIYDDVAVDHKTVNKRISLIPTMDSDEEESVEDLLYDDTDVIPSPSLPSSSLPSLPPAQLAPPVQQTNGSDDVPQEIYDDVSVEGESEELYEALDVSAEDKQSLKRPSLEPSDSADVTAQQASLLSPKKTPSANSRQEEKQRKEQEKQEQQKRKKEEELRKKREKEEKKRKEKEEKEMKKKFNIKGDIHVLDTGTAIQDCGSDYEKADLVCKRGNILEIIRREGNPPGKWLVRDSQGRYGFVDADFIAVESDCQETYDDVIPCDDSGSEAEAQQELYEAFN